MKNNLLICLICLPIWAIAQQLPLFTQYREMRSIINPAALYCDNLYYNDYTTFFGITYRDQWSGKLNTPKTQIIQGDHLHLGDAVNLVYGGYIINDQVGRVGNTGVYGKIAGLFTSDIREAGILGGFSVGYNQYRLNLSNLNARDANDVLASESQKKLYPDAGIGAFAYKRVGEDNMLFGGLSIPQLFSLDLQFKSKERDYVIQRNRHYFGTIGFFKPLNDEYSFIELNSWVKYIPGAPLSVDLNIRSQISNILWLGGGISTNYNVHLETGVVLGENIGFEHIVKICYGFDTQFSKVGPAYGNTHEISISYGLPTRGRNRYF